MMENDIQIQQLSKINEQKDEKLKKMKSNIQKLQMNMNKKREITSSQVNNIKKQPMTSYNNIKNNYLYHERQYDNHNVNNAQEFGYNSNLFRQLNNQSQGVLQNGSAVSNFSSVSNINNLLNFNADNLHQQHKPSQAYKFSKQSGTNYKDQPNIIINKNFSSSNDPKILSDIDKLLQKTKQSKKSTPFKQFQKYPQPKQINQTKLNNQSSKIIFQDEQNKNSTKNKLNEYKRFIESLGSLNNHNQKDNKFYKTEDNYINSQKGGYKKYNFQTFTNFNQNQFQAINNKKQKNEPLKYNQMITKHKKNQFSNITNKSEYLYNYSKNQHSINIKEQSHVKMPPTPPLSNRKSSNNIVQRQKAQIQSSIQQYKQLENQIIHDQNIVQLDFELSDDDSQQKQQENKKKQQKISKLLAQKQMLLKELQQIDKELQELQNSI